MTKVTGFDYLRAFDEAAFEVLNEVLGEPPVRGKPTTLMGPTVTLEEVTVNIGIAGALAGHVRLGMAQATALAIASEMMGEPVAALDEMSLSALCELVNMIAGTARSALNQTGEVSEITPPSIVVGSGGSETWYHLRMMTLPLSLRAGTVNLTVGIRPTKVGDN